MKRLLAMCCGVMVALSAPHINIYAQEPANQEDLNRETTNQDSDIGQNGAEEENPEELPEELQELLREAQTALGEIVSHKNVMALVYLADNYEVRREPSPDSESIVTVHSGQQVLIQDVYLDSSYNVWEKVQFTYLDQSYEGYIERANLACSDQDFLNWEMQYSMNSSYLIPQPMLLAEGRASVTYADVEQFPESYREALRTLKEAHPNWTFVKMNTNLSWPVVVENELYADRSLVPASFDDSMKRGSYNSSWALASQKALEYYLDPRNWLNESYIFQFEQLTYNESYHKEAAVQNFLNNTFMKGNMPGTSQSYANAFWQIGRSLGVSPFHLACRVYQEQGAGTSPLISGTYAGYEGYYNYFNIEASGKTNQQIYETGLAAAKKYGWDTVYKSLEGGAKIISTNYILAGQDTLYLQKFDVDDSAKGLYWHQYMQNICAPSSEGMNIRKLYQEAGSLENTFVFKIPVYNDMPNEAVAKPVDDYNVIVVPPEGYTGTEIYLDGVAYQGTKSGVNLCVTAKDKEAKTAVMYKYNDKNVPVGMYVWELTYKNGQYNVKAVPQLQDLLTYHGFSIRITGKAGIRFKTGISTDLRSKLMTDGVEGYTVKEYGTLVMNYANISTYPLVKGSAMAVQGLAYGVGEDGKKINNIFEKVDGRSRYTSVLVGLPVERYKTEYAFRGYIILTKDNVDYTFYGPVVARSIYNISNQLISSGQYAEGSEVDTFLKKLISDADAYEESQKPKN
ncbi:MAG: N-acetylglucosaminidase [Lachnospiraceae bacterium]